ncbi:MAG: glycoside hydrolase family 97 N-terminal domain-containing protein [Candidatus Aminicenantes bacterium]|jgi:hypothetical protein
MNAKKTLFSFLSIIFVFLFTGDSIFARVYKLHSPGEQIEVKVHVNQVISYEVYCKGKHVIKPSPISMTIHHNKGSATPTYSRSARCRSLGASSQTFAEKTKFHKVLVKRVRRRQVNKIIKPVVPVTILFTSRKRRVL